jgi:DnaB-like helicase N terminal domain/AAA domain
VHDSAPRRLPSEAKVQLFYRGNRPVESIERPLPQSLDMERGVIAAIMLDDSVPNATLHLANLQPEDFFFENHRKTFRHLVALDQAGKPADLSLLKDAMESAHELEACGGAGGLAQLIDLVPRVANVEHFVRSVKEKSLRRRIIYNMNAIEQAAFQSEEDVDGILSRAREAINAFSTGVASEPAAWRDVFHAFEDFENAQPLNFAIKGFLQNDGATMIGGLSGHGKTLILLSITKALLAGKGARLWDLFDVEENAVRVVYLIPECAIQPFKHRLRLFGLYDYLAPNDNRLLVRTLSKGPAPLLSDPRILFAVKGAHVTLDTATRFGDGDENSASDNQKGLATDIFALLAAGAKSVIAAHHSPKTFTRENVMRLENVLRGSGDVGAMLTTAWGIKQIDAAQNIIHIENIKPRDFQPCAPFQIIGRPFIDDDGDFRLQKRPGECGSLIDEQEPERDHGGAPAQAREARAANIALLRQWLCEEPSLNSIGLSRKFAAIGIKIGDSAIRRYRKEIGV